MNIFSVLKPKVRPIEVPKIPEISTTDVRLASACLAERHVVKLNSVLADQSSTLMELRDAIESTDYFVTNYKEGTGKQKDAAFGRFKDKDTTKSIPAFPLAEVPLGMMAMEQLFAQNHLLSNVIKSHFGDRVYSFHTCWVRPSNSSQSGRRTLWLWHQDKPFHKGDDLTIWIPLSKCGRTAPGVEFLVGCDEVLTLDQNGWSVENNTVEKLEATASLFTPEFNVGDCIVFDGLAVHRTHAKPEMNDERTSIDIRVTANPNG